MIDDILVGVPIVAAGAAGTPGLNRADIAMSYRCAAPGFGNAAPLQSAPPPDAAFSLTLGNKQRFQRSRDVGYRNGIPKQ